MTANMNSKRMGRTLRVGAALMALAVFGTGAAAPLLRASGHESAAAICRAALSSACHQKAERSFYVAGFPMALCARCAAMYAAMPAAFLVLGLLWPAPSVSRGFFWAAAALVPMGMDGVLQAFNFYDAPLLRAATGALGGVGVALLWHGLFTVPPEEEASVSGVARSPADGFSHA